MSFEKGYAEIEAIDLLMEDECFPSLGGPTLGIVGEFANHLIPWAERSLILFDPISSPVFNGHVASIRGIASWINPRNGSEVHQTFGRSDYWHFGHTECSLNVSPDAVYFNGFDYANALSKRMNSKYGFMDLKPSDFYIEAKNLQGIHIRQP